MKLYLDLIFLLNFMFDFLLLSAVAIILHRQVKLKYLLLGASLGASSIFILFININSLELFLIKVVISILMCLITFGYQTMKYTLKNIFYLYSASLILGGALYFLNMEFSYKQTGLIFYHNGVSVNFFVLIIASPIIIYFYIKQARELKCNYNNYYQVDIILKNDEKITVSAFLDTGNNLTDPYFNKPIILLESSLIDKFIDDFVLVPYESLNHQGMLKCIRPKRVEVVGLGIYKNVLIGLSLEKIKIDGVSCLLNNYMKGEAIC